MKATPLATVAALLGAAALAGCETVGSLAQMGGIHTLGVLPAEDFSLETSEDYGLVRLAVGGTDLAGNPLVPLVYLLEVDAEGSEVSIESSEDVQGHPSGDLLLPLCLSRASLGLSGPLWVRSGPFLVCSALLCNSSSSQDTRVATRQQQQQQQQQVSKLNQVNQVN